MKAEVTQLNPLDVQKTAHLTLCLRLGCSFLLQLTRWWMFGKGAENKGVSVGLATAWLRVLSSVGHHQGTRLKELSASEEPSEQKMPDLVIFDIQNICWSKVVD